MALGHKSASGYQHYEDPKKFTKKYLPLNIVEALMPLFVGRAIAGQRPVTRAECLELAGIPLPVDPQKNIIEGPSVRRGRLLPIYAAAQGGEGHIIIDHTPIDQMEGPEELLHVKNSYGILIVGESMVPAYRPGDIAWVHPHKLPERDTDVVLYHVPPHDQAEAIIKTLVSWSPREWKLRQYQPPLDYTQPIVDWPVCHRIVAKKNAR